MTTVRTLLAGAVLLLAVLGCDAAPAASGSPEASATVHTGISGAATAGPVCPVERVPPDPSCAPRPVAGATLIVRDGAGREVARAITAADGTFLAAVAPGTYRVEPQPVKGLLGTAPPKDVTVGAGAPTTIAVVYDTGIR